MKRLMLVAGGPLQVALIKQAKEMGLYVFNTSKEADSPCFEYADEYEAVDLLDKERHLQIAKAFQPHGIVTDQSEIAVETVAYLAEELNLPGIGSKYAQLFTNKYCMRELCKKNNVLQPDYRHCSTVEDAADFLGKYGKIVLKPLNSQASKGVSIITADSQLEHCFEVAQGYCRQCSGVLAEEFISGIEHTVDGIKANDSHVSLAVSRKQHFKESPAVASIIHFSHFSTEKIKKQNNRLIDSTELPFGLTHAEYIERDGDYYLVEVAARGGGVNISSLIVPFMSGVQNNQMLIRMAFGEHISASDLIVADDYLKRECVIDFFNFHEGRVRKITGTDVLVNNPHILEYKLPSPGDIISPPSDDTKRYGHYIAGADSATELERKCKQIRQAIKVEYD